MVRNLANLVLAASKGQPKERGATQQHGGTANAAELNLLGDREFLTSDSAREALAPMLAPDSAITKVIGDGCTAVNLNVFWKAVVSSYGSWLCGFAAEPSCPAWLHNLSAEERAAELMPLILKLSSSGLSTWCHCKEQRCASSLMETCQPSDSDRSLLLLQSPLVIDCSCVAPKG